MIDKPSTLPYLREVVIFLVAAGVAVPLLQRLRISPVLAYLLLGGLIGPFGLGLIADQHPILSRIVITDVDGVRALAELGVIFLLFMIGLELSFERLRTMRKLVFGLGSLQVLVTGAVIAVIAFQFGNPLPASVVLGACLALSSTAIVMQLLVHSRRLGTPAGRAGFSILLMQDLAVIPVLFLVSALGAGSGAGIVRDLAAALASAVVIVALLYATGRLVLRPALQLLLQTRRPEAFMAAVLLIVIGAAAITGSAGLPMALGAFLAGLLLAETEYRREVEINIEPFKGLMLGLFFMSVGMGIDWRMIGQDPIWIVASAAGLILLKAIITAALCRAVGLALPVAAETGLLLAQGGEFAFLVVGLATTLGILPAATGQFMLIVAGLTMLATPLLAAGAQRLGQILASRAPGQAAEMAAEVPAQEGHVILAGFGRVGQTVADLLEAEGFPYLAIDSDPQLVAEQLAQRRQVVFGNASRLKMLHRTHVEKASAVVVTMDDAEAAEHIVEQIGTYFPQVPIYARATDGAHARRLRQAGAMTAVPETTEGSLQLSARLLTGLGITLEGVQQRIEQRRRLEEARLDGEDPEQPAPA